MKKNNHTLTKALISFSILSIVILAVSTYFVFQNEILGFAFLLMGLLVTILLKFFKIKVKEVYPDIIFGMIDNGILVLVAILGGMYAGVIGAVVGGIAGNTLTDGIGGLFEGHIAEKLRNKKINENRTSLSTMLGKIIGCLLGAGIGLILFWLINLI